MRPTNLLALAALTIIAFLACVTTAGAATRYAGNNSAVVSGACDQQAVPCRLDHAVNSAGSNDTVVVLPGDYNVTYSVLATQLVHVRGQAGQPRPRLLGGAALAGATLNLPKGGTAEHLYVESQSSSSALSTKEVTVTDVIAYSATSNAADAKAGSGSVIRDSVFQSTAGSPYSALKLWDDQVTGPIDVVNVTAVAGGAGSIGIDNGAGGPVTVVNTIARGASKDINLGAVVQNATVSYSSYRPVMSTGVTAGAGNQLADPLFADASLREAAGSPTIDAGTAGVTLGSADPDGNSRTLGSAPDIGAFEAAGSGNGSTGGGSTGTTGTTTGTGGTGTGDSTGDPATDGSGSGKPAELPPVAPPVIGKSVGLGPVRGSVTVQLPGSSQAVPLGAGASVPVGSIIDASAGVIALTSVRDSSGKTQTGRFWGGAFRVLQSRRGGSYTELQLVGKPSDCRARGRLNAAARRWTRRLWGRDRGGRFRTRGRNGSATVRGTEWLTEERCEGTFFRVKTGKIVVRDLVKRKNVALKRGGSYLARKR